MNFEKATFFLNTANSIKSNGVSPGGNNPQGSPYTITNIVSTWNVSLRQIMKNIYDKYSRIYLTVRMISAGYGNPSLGSTQTWDNLHLLKLSGLTFPNTANTYIYMTSWTTARSTGTCTIYTEDNGVVVDISSDDQVSISATMVQSDLMPPSSPYAYPDYIIFFNVYGIPGYERNLLTSDKNHF